ncbi:MAG: VanW family protein [Candidatus Microgenomates bacterium]|jgi:vancomycin resistance protein YoaR
MAKQHNLKRTKKVFRQVSKIKFSRLITPLLFVLAIILGSFASYLIAYYGKIYPNTKIAGLDISGRSPTDSITLLNQYIVPPEELTLYYQGHLYNIKTNDIDFSYDFAVSAETAYEYTRTGFILKDLVNRLDIIVHPKDFPLVTNINNDKLNKILSSISGQISVKPVNPTINLVDGKIIINKGSPGIEVNQEALTALIEKNLATAKTAEIEIPVSITDNTLSQTEADSLQSRAAKYLGKNIQMKFEYNTLVLNDSDILKLLDPESGYNEQAITDFIQKTATSVDRNPVNPKFVFTGGKVTEFQPALDGIKTDQESFKNQLTASLDKLESTADLSETFDIPVAKNLPEVSTDEVNNLGIKELIGRGVSTYFHSADSRVHNVVLAASRINGTLVKPGDTFSFNTTLGDVSAFTGYQQAYIISEGRTVLGDGGGVCQVSTTLFRAILNAGLPVIERTAHAYRVGYYEQDSPPGFDATVYGPEPDLKFKNDTPAYILIEAQDDPKNYSLTFELYGTSDGRVANTSKPVVSNITPAPPALYQDDPTLPAGTIKQTDFAASGAKVVFNYSVTRDGKQIYQKTFVSNYQPWQAVYLRGTGPAI